MLSLAIAPSKRSRRFPCDFAVNSTVFKEPDVQRLHMARNTFTIVPDGPFSLCAAANFGFGHHAARPNPKANTMALAFTMDSLTSQTAVYLRQNGTATVHGEIFGDADAQLVQKQVARVLSLDRSGTAWLEIGKRDPIIGRLQQDLPGLRPVLFYSPYEAAAWSVLSQRRHRSQAALLRKQLCAAHGSIFALPDGALEAFPSPQTLLQLAAFPGIESQRMQRLHGIARAALDGRLEPQRLLAMTPQAALEDLQKLPGIGPFYAGLVLLRSTGATDILTLREPHMPAYMSHFYKFEKDAVVDDQILQIAEAWRPFRTWAMVLIRVAGDRAGLSFRV